jgi:phage repressor protein C with HTH and peptisase S24 domain
MWEGTYMSEAPKTPFQLLIASAVAQLPKRRDHYDREIQKILKTTGKPLYDISRRAYVPKRETLKAIAEVLGQPITLLDRALDGDTVSPVSAQKTGLSEAGPRGDRPDHAQTRTADAGETVSIMRMDLSYAMGPGTNLDDSYVEGEPIVFDLSFIRSLTPSPPHMLRVVDGIGDSMSPTIGDREWLIIDLAQRVLNMQDRIWAISLFGAGAVKRLRAISKTSVLVISDNPDVADQEVDIDDLSLVARLVGSIKRH